VADDAEKRAFLIYIKDNSCFTAASAATATLQTAAAVHHHDKGAQHSDSATINGLLGCV
jgi:hypothetical protein